MDYFILRNGKERHRDTAREKEKKEQDWECEWEREREGERWQKRERDDRGVFMDVVSEHGEMLRLLWTSIQRKEHDGKSASVVTGLLYKSWGATPTLCWLQIQKSVWLCWPLKSFSLVSSPYTTGNAVQFPFQPLCAYRPSTTRACMKDHRDFLQWGCFCSSLFLYHKWNIFFSHFDHENMSGFLVFTTQRHDEKRCRYFVD